MLLVPRRFELKAYDKHLNLLGVLIGRNSDAHSASFTVEYNAVGTGHVTLPLDHKLAAALVEPGARLHYRWIDHTGNPELQLSGGIEATTARISLREGTITLTCVSDEVLIRETLAWPLPTAPIGSQSVAYDMRTGPVDQVCADIVAAALTRVGSPARVIPDVRTGPTVTIAARMHPLIDVIKEPLETAHYGIRCYQWMPGDQEPFFLAGQLTAPTILVEVYQCRDRPYVKWTPQLGINSGTATSTRPSVTRVVVAGGGEGTARVFIQVIDAAKESLVGPLGIRERIIDARDTSDVNVLEQRALEALNEGVGTSSLDLDVYDGDPWVYGQTDHYVVGDVVRLEVVPGVVKTEKVKAVTVAIDSDNGITVRPRIGDPSPVNDPQVAILRTQAKHRTRTISLETRR